MLDSNKQAKVLNYMKKDCKPRKCLMLLPTAPTYLRVHNNDGVAAVGIIIVMFGIGVNHVVMENTHIADMISLDVFAACITIPRLTTLMTTTAAAAAATTTTTTTTNNNNNNAVATTITAAATAATATTTLRHHHRNYDFPVSSRCPAAFDVLVLLKPVSKPCMAPLSFRFSCLSLLPPRSHPKTQSSGRQGEPAPQGDGRFAKSRGFMIAALTIKPPTPSMIKHTNMISVHAWHLSI